MMAPKLPSDPDALWIALEPLFARLSNGTPDFRALRATLPKAKTTVKKARALTVEGALIVAGSLTVTDGVTLGDNAMLVVLGKLTVRGGLWSEPHAFSAVVAGGTVDVDRAHTAGEVLAFAGITAKLWWTGGNDHSTYAPTLKSEVYIAEDRHDVIPKLTAASRLVAFDVRAQLARIFPALDPADPAAVRGLVGGAQPKQVRATSASPGELEALRAQLAAMWAIEERGPRVKAMRAIYAAIAKRRLVEAGPLLLEMIERKHVARAEEWSVQDELDLLVKLRRADLLEAIPAPQLGGYASWLPGLVAKART